MRLSRQTAAGAHSDIRGGRLELKAQVDVNRTFSLYTGKTRINHNLRIRVRVKTRAWA